MHLGRRWVWVWVGCIYNCFYQAFVQVNHNDEARKGMNEIGMNKKWVIELCRWQEKFIFFQNVYNVICAYDIITFVHPGYVIYGELKLWAKCTEIRTLFEWLTDVWHYCHGLRFISLAIDCAMWFISKQIVCEIVSWESCNDCSKWCLLNKQ